MRTLNDLAFTLWEKQNWETLKLGCFYTRNSNYEKEILCEKPKTKKWIFRSFKIKISNLPFRREPLLLMDFQNESQPYTILFSVANLKLCAGKLMCYGFWYGKWIQVFLGLTFFIYLICWIFCRNLSSCMVVRFALSSLSMVIFLPW